MKSVIIAVKDEEILSKLRVAFFDDDIKYIFASSSDEAVRIAQDNTVFAAVIDYDFPKVNNEALYDSLLKINNSMQIIMLINDEDILDAIALYNDNKLLKIIDKSNYSLEDFSNFINEALFSFNSINIDDNSLISSEYSENMLKHLHEMSDVLNEKLLGYQIVIRMYNDCIRFIGSFKNENIKTFEIFVDRVINDYIQLYMVREPDFDLYINNLNITFNKPEEKKYFKFSSNSKDIDRNKKKNIMLIIDILTICFDLFFESYRGKIELASDRKYIYINASYEVRPTILTPEENINEFNVADTVLKICNSMTKKFADESKFAKNGNMIQYKAIFNNYLKENA